MNCRHYMGNNCALFLPIDFFHSYDAKFVQELLRKGEKKLAQLFNYTFRYIVELVGKDTTDSPKSPSYLYLEHDINGTLMEL